MMKRLLQFFFMLTVGVSAYSQDSQALTYNAVATAYVQTTISQSVVFDSNMQAGGTFTFSVLAHNGGGRAGQSDTANVKIQFYTAAGTLVSTVNTNLSANLPQPTQSGTVNTQGTMLSGNPQADPAVPWTTLSTSSSNCGGSCATVAYAVVSMYGVDGSYWAGDYGPWYRAPTLQLNGGGNLLYNPEFGPYNGTNVQGWNINPGLGACQGAWGGSNACIVNSDGVPGSNTVGLVANQNGGGPSPTGGTTSGTAGGYNNTMSVANPGPGTTGGATAPAAPTVTGTTITYTTRSVVSNGITYVYQTPVTTTNYSDGTSTSTTGTESLYQIVYPSYATVGAGTPGNMSFGSAAPLTQAQQAKVDAWNSKTIQNGNLIDIQQVSGGSNTVTMDQTGSKNIINATLAGTNNNITANQGVTGVGQNEMKLNFEGNNNVVKLNQARDTQGNPLGTNGHYLDATIAGWGTNLTVQQANAGGVGGHFNETTIYGNGNTVAEKQLDNGNKIMFIKVNGAINNVDATQRGTGQHKLDVTLTGDRNNATVLQEGSTANNATISLTNVGGQGSVNVQQNGGQSVGFSMSCATAGGCAPVTIRQGY